MAVVQCLSFYVNMFFETHGLIMITTTRTGQNEAEFVKGKWWVNLGLVAGVLNDLHVYEPTSRRWTDLSGESVSGPAPSARSRHGFTAAGGQLYVFGGGNLTGQEGDEKGGEE